MTANYNKALKHATKTIPYAKEFATLYPGLVTSFTHYTGEYGASFFNADIGLYGRYILKMDVKVTFDKTRTKIVNYAEPEFSFVEVAKVGTAANGNLTIEYNTSSARHFGLKEWKEIVKNNGDFSVLGIKIVTDKPFPGFENFWEQG